MCVCVRVPFCMTLKDGGYSMHHVQGSAFTVAIADGEQFPGLWANAASLELQTLHRVPCDQKA